MRIRRLLNLPFPRWICVFQAFFVLAFIALGLKLFSFRKVNRWLNKGYDNRPPKSINRARIESVCWAVPRVSRILLGNNSCLPQALAGQFFLQGLGLPVALRLGVRKGSNGDIIAHAWVENEGKILIGARGDPDLREFERFPEFS